MALAWSSVIETCKIATIWESMGLQAAWHANYGQGAIMSTMTITMFWKTHRLKKPAADHHD